MANKIAGLEEYLRDMEQGVYNFTKEGKCSCCGSCCSNILPLSKDEIKVIARYKKKHHIQDTTKQDGVDFNFVCPFRDNEKRICTIYEVRPLICRDFLCNKSHPDIEARRDYLYSTRKTVFMREVFFNHDK